MTATAAREASNNIPLGMTSLRVMNLIASKISDKKWVEAMSVISDSVQVASSKSYIRMYKRDEKGEYKQILLDFASL